MATKLALREPWDGNPAFTVLVLCEDHAREAKPAAIPESIIFNPGDACDVCEQLIRDGYDVLEKDGDFLLEEEAQS